MSKLSQWPKWWLLGAVIVVCGISISNTLLICVGIVFCVSAAVMQIVRVVALYSNRK